MHSIAKSNPKLGVKESFRPSHPQKTDRQNKLDTTDAVSSGSGEKAGGKNKVNGKNRIHKNEKIVVENGLLKGEVQISNIVTAVKPVTSGELLIHLSRMYGIIRETETLGKISKISFNTSSFPAVVIKTNMEGENITMLVFGNGKIILTGATNTEKIPVIVNKIVDAIYNSDYSLEYLTIDNEPAKISPENFEYKITNIVSSGTITVKKTTKNKNKDKHKNEANKKTRTTRDGNKEESKAQEVLSNLELISLWMDNTAYDKEKFPGAIHMDEENRVTNLIFPTNSLIITGAREIDQIVKNIENILEQLTELAILS